MLLPLAFSITHRLDKNICPLLASLLSLIPISLLRESVIKCFEVLIGVCPFHNLLAFLSYPGSPPLSKAVPKAHLKISGLSPDVLQP